MTTETTTIETTAVDDAKLEQFMGQMVGDMTGSALCFGVWVGDELGLYQALAGAGPLTADELASRAGCHRRLVREWLDGQVAGGLVGYDATDDRYQLSPEAAIDASTSAGRGNSRGAGLALTIVAMAVLRSLHFVRIVVVPLLQALFAAGAPAPVVRWLTDRVVPRNRRARGG